MNPALGLAFTFHVLACGGTAANDTQLPPPSYSVPRATPMSPLVVSAPQQPQRPQPALTPVPEQPPAPPPQPGMTEAPAYLLRAAAENVLVGNCGQCHGPNLTRAQAQGGINFINDGDQLAEAGLIVPLSSATSRVIVVMCNGSMPPASSGLPPVTEADIALVAAYVDNPLYWSDVQPSASVDAGVPSMDAGADAGSTRDKQY